jgi:serine/threonine protein phosphatase PrpC
MIKPVFAGATDVGLVRAVNQDAYFIDEAGRFFIVADGMGGHAAGQEASRIAQETIHSYLDAHWDSDKPSEILLEEAFRAANRAIIDDQKINPQNADMGTTAVAAIFRAVGDEEPSVWCGNLGDSRIYHQTKAGLSQVTEDDTWVAQAVRMGAIEVEEVRSHPWRHVLAQCLGREDMGDIEVLSLSVQPGDRLLLCSDGLTEELEDDSIAQDLQHESCEVAANSLIAAAKEAGGHDNITVIVVDVTE